MKIAAIDLGSNSIHLVIVEVRPSGGFHVVASEKEMVRLGQTTLSRGRLSATAMARGLEVLREYPRLCRSHRVDKVLAVATSAIREARNGEDYLMRIGQKTGIWPRVVSGQGEARLIYPLWRRRTAPAARRRRPSPRIRLPQRRGAPRAPAGRRRAA